jgi:hypothetical protein
MDNLLEEYVAQEGYDKGTHYPRISLFCVEALSSLIYHAERTSLLAGVATSKKGPGYQ